MRILIIDKTAGLDASHERHVALSQQPDVELHVLGPRHWIENGREVIWRPEQNDLYTAHVGLMFGKDYYARAGYYSGLCRALAQTQPDIIQLLEEPWSISALQTVIAASMLAPLARILFYTWENIYRPWVYPSRASQLYAMIDKLLHHRSTAAVCATHGARHVMRKKEYTKPIAIIPYGIPQYFLEEKTDLQRGISEPSFTIGYIGRFLHMKGIDLLLHAIASIPDVHLILTGSGEEEPQFRNIARQLGIQERVKWHAPVPEKMIPEYLRLMDVFVLPSRTTEGWQEQLGRVAIEAMACGIPVIASTSGAIPEVVGGAGLLFQENSVESLIHQINQLRHCASQRNRLRHAGRQRVEQRFTWTRFAQDLCSFYRTIMQQE